MSTSILKIERKMIYYSGTESLIISFTTWNLYPTALSDLVLVLPSYAETFRCCYVVHRPLDRMPHTETRISAIADKTRDAFRGQSRSPNMVPFHMLGMISCAIVTLSVRRTVFEIGLFEFKNAMTLKTGSWRSLKISPFDREPMTSYWCSIVTVALSRVVSEILNVDRSL